MQSRNSAKQKVTQSQRSSRNGSRTTASSSKNKKKTLISICKNNNSKITIKIDKPSVVFGNSSKSNSSSELTQSVNTQTEDTYEATSGTIRNFYDGGLFALNPSSDEHSSQYPQERFRSNAIEVMQNMRANDNNYDNIRRFIDVAQSTNREEHMEADKETSMNEGINKQLNTNQPQDIVFSSPKNRITPNKLIWESCDNGILEERKIEDDVTPSHLLTLKHPPIQQFPAVNHQKN